MPVQPRTLPVPTPFATRSRPLAGSYATRPTGGASVPSRRTTCCRRSATCPTTRAIPTSGSPRSASSSRAGRTTCRTCLEALVAHLPAGVVVVALDLGNVDGAGDVLHELAAANPGVIDELHVERPAGWAAARTALLKHDVATVHVLLDPATVLEGDALSPVLAAFDDPTVVGAGWRGVNVDLADEWRVLRRRRTGGGRRHPRLPLRRTTLRGVGRRWPASQGAVLPQRGHGAQPHAARGGRPASSYPRTSCPYARTGTAAYHDSDPTYRDAESAKTYHRLLQRFRGREDILAPRG